MEKTLYDPLKTILIITVGLIITYIITKMQWFLNIALLTGLIGVFSTYLSKIINSFWLKLSWLLSLIIPNLLLSIIYFLLLTPIAWLSRLFGQQNQLNINNTKKSLFKNTNNYFNKEFFERTW